MALYRDLLHGRCVISRLVCRTEWTEWFTSPLGQIPSLLLGLGRIVALKPFDGLLLASR